MRTTLEFACENCGSTVYRERRKINPGQKLFFCNRKCWQEYMTRKPIPVNFRVVIKHQPKWYVCDKCGKNFRRITRWGESKRGSFCSQECATTNPWGLGNFKPRIFRYKSTARAAIKLRYLDQCAICHWSEATCDAHHIYPLKEGGPNVLSNLILLCPNHHRLADIGILSCNELEKARRTMIRIPGLPHTAFADYDGSPLP